MVGSDGISLGWNKSNSLFSPSSGPAHSLLRQIASPPAPMIRTAEVFPMLQIPSSTGHSLQITGDKALRALCEGFVVYTSSSTRIGEQQPVFRSGGISPDRWFQGAAAGGSELVRRAIVIESRASKGFPGRMGNFQLFSDSTPPPPPTWPPDPRVQLRHNFTSPYLPTLMRTGSGNHCNQHAGNC